MRLRPLFRRASAIPGSKSWGKGAKTPSDGGISRFTTMFGANPGSERIFSRASLLSIKIFYLRLNTNSIDMKVNIAYTNKHWEGEI
jgi:hypothetical protein